MGCSNYEKQTVHQTNRISFKLAYMMFRGPCNFADLQQTFVCLRKKPILKIHWFWPMVIKPFMSTMKMLARCTVSGEILGKSSFSNHLSFWKCSIRSGLVLFFILKWQYMFVSFSSTVHLFQSMFIFFGEKHTPNCAATKEYCEKS